MISIFQFLSKSISDQTPVEPPSSVYMAWFNVSETQNEQFNQNRSVRREKAPNTTLPGTIFSKDPVQRGKEIIIRLADNIASVTNCFMFKTVRTGEWGTDSTIAVRQNGATVTCYIGTTSQTSFSVSAGNFIKIQYQFNGQVRVLSSTDDSNYTVQHTYNPLAETNYYFGLSPSSFKDVVGDGYSAFSVIVKDIGSEYGTTATVSSAYPSITNNGIEVPLFVISGQSNTGFAKTSAMTTGQAAEYNSVNGRCKILSYQMAPNSFQDLSPGVNTNLYVGDDGTFGPEVSLFKKFADQDSQIRYLVKAAVNASSMPEYWNTMKSGEFNLKHSISKALELLHADGKKPVLKGFIWVQGEQDSAFENYANAYATNLAAFMKDFEFFWSNKCAEYSLSTAPFKKIIYRLHPSSGGSLGQYRGPVRAAQYDYCQTPANNAVMINSDAWTLFDLWHLDATSQIAFGNELFNQLKNL